VAAAHLHAALAVRYAGQPCIALQPLGGDVDAQRLDPRALNGSNRIRLAVFGQERTGQVLLAAVFDNLGKGAAGAAVQNLDLMLGLSAARTQAPSTGVPDVRAA
jgi:N-acetyl-gamma-glutamyl-phosphate reductase